MTPERAGTAQCALCGGDVAGTPLAGDDGRQFCSPGCRDVAATLDELPERPSDPGDAHVSDADGSTGSDADERAASGATAGARDDLEVAFLRVDGMHSATCETFVERRAEGTDGVHAADASYVTETARIAHDPRQVSVEDLCDRLSTLGYTALPRADVPVDAAARVEPTGGDTESGGARSRDTDQTRGRARERERARERHARERNLDDLLGYRYAAAVLFGSFLLLPYAVVVYPSHIGEMLGLDALAIVAADTGFGSGEGVFLLPFFLSMSGVVVIFAGMPLLRGAYVGLRVRRPNTELLVTATVLAALGYSTLAVFQGRTDVFYDATAVVAAVVVAAIFYESLVKREAMDRLTDLTVSRVGTATRYGPDGTTWPEDVADLAPGDRVLVRQGERVPVDGTVLEGPCAVDEAVVTGESLPVTKREGDDLLGGSVVVEGAAVVRVADAVTSSLDRLAATVWDVQSATHGQQRRADRLAGVALPAVGAVAALVGIAMLVLGEGIGAAALGGLGVVLVALPWGIGLATPLSVATNVRAALDRGIVVFDESIFERLRDVDVVVFDKTGTLTTGDMTVVDADAPDDLLAAAGALEQRAAHPAGAAIARAFGPGGDGAGGDGAGGDGADGGGSGGDGPDGDRTAADGGDGTRPQSADAVAVERFETHATGVEGDVDGATVLVGAPQLFDEAGWTVGDALQERVATARQDGNLPVLVGRDGTAEGLVLVGDRARDGWGDVLSGVAGDGDRAVVVLTGDDEAAATDFLDHPAVEHVFAGIPPAGKTEAIRRLQATGRVAMVGDGTNDAPALAAADLGISLGGGTALAADAADVTILEDDLGAVRTAFELAGAAVERTRQTFWLSFAFNAVAIPAALVGTLNPVVMVIGLGATGLLVGGNSARELLPGS